MRIAFVVQPDWLNIHFGVRNLFVSCAKILEIKGNTVDFLIEQRHATEVLWYRQSVSDSYLKSSILKTTVGTQKSYKNLTENNRNIPNINVQFLGNCIDKLYDHIIFTNPWLINDILNISSNIQKSLICYDCIANELAFVDNSVIPWGYAHNSGYKYAKNNNVTFLSISQKTDNEIVKYYAPAKHDFLPPVVTYAFMDINDTIIPKENAVLLAAPFDMRKGLKDIPKILNALKDDFDTLYIYGTPRCGKKLYKNFYKELKVKNVIHYDNITSEDLISLYKKCKVLLFPSLEEGLGMPIIEAQLCGCRVVTTDKKPMNELLCDGNYLLTDDFEKDIVNIKRMLTENGFNYKNLANEAKTKFSIGKVYKVFEKILGLKEQL